MSKKVIRTSIGFTFLSLATAGVNFLYYPVLAHFLAVRDFGDVQAGISFIMLAGTLFTSLSILSMFVTALGMKNEQIKTHHFERVIIAISCLAAVITLLFSHQLAGILQLSHPSLLYILSAIFIINIPAVSWVGALQGNNQFIASGLASLTSAIMKIVLSIVFMALGYGAFGALLGTILGLATTLPFILLVQKNHVVSFRRTFSLPTREDIRFIQKHHNLTKTFVALVLFYAISTLDVFFAKAFLDPINAGYFAQQSTAAKIPYYALAPVALVLFQAKLSGRSSNKKMLYAYGLLAALSSVAIAFGGKIILRFVFNYHGPSSWLSFSLLLAAYGLFSVSLLWLYMFIADRAVHKAAILATASIVIAVVSLGFFHGTIISIALALSISLFFSLLIALILTYTRVHGKDTAGVVNHNSGIQRI